MAFYILKYEYDTNEYWDRMSGIAVHQLLKKTKTMKPITLLFRTDEKEEIKEFMTNLERGFTGQMFINIEKIKSAKVGERNLLNIISIKSVIPQWVPMVLLVVSLVFYLWFGWWVFILLSLLFFLTMYPFSSLMLWRKTKKRLKEKGYIGELKKVSMEEGVLLLYGEI